MLALAGPTNGMLLRRCAAACVGGKCAFGTGGAVADVCDKGGRNVAATGTAVTKGVAAGNVRRC